MRLPRPDLDGVPPAFEIQVAGGHPDARFFECFPDGGGPEGLSFIPHPSGQAPSTRFPAIPALDQQDLVFFHLPPERKPAWFTSLGYGEVWEIHRETVFKVDPISWTGLSQH